jgi:SOS-response transcriptional repressor LexA
MADALDIGLRHYQKIEQTGKTTLVTLEMIAEVLGEPLIAFFIDEGSNISAPVQLYRVPVVNTIPAGGFTKSFEDMIAEEFTTTDVHLPGTFALRVTGDSMSPKIEDGDLAILTPDQPFENGKVYAVIAGDSAATLKMVKRSNGGYYCIPLNAAYEPFFVPDSEMIALYKVMRVIKEWG